MQYKQYTEEWFVKNKYTEEWDKVTDEYFAKKKSFKNYLECISDYIQTINEYLLKRDYDTVREYAGYVESTIERERKTMEEIPELKSPETEKFLEESLNEAKAALRKCPSRNSNTNTNTNTNTPWSGRYYKEESWAEKNARWRYEESQQEYRNMQWLQQQPWFNH